MRRAALGLLARVIVPMALWPRRASAAGAVRRRERACAAERRLAMLGARIATDDPVLARALRRRAGRRSPQALLARDRVGREFAGGEVLAVGGWLIARTEAMAALRAHARARPDDGAI